MAALAVLTAPVAVLGAASGEVLLGLVAFVSAGWLGSFALVGWRAEARADAHGVVVRWMGTTEEVAWDQVAAVEVDRIGVGGVRRGASLLTTTGRRLRWAPWFPFLWFAHRGVVASLEQLGELLAARDGGPTLTDPDAPDDDTSSWTRPRR